MARAPMSPESRALKVMDAAETIAALIIAARDSAMSQGHDHPETLAAWEAVEEAGATIHRQARLLAGKSRGG